MNTITCHTLTVTRPATTTHVSHAQNTPSDEDLLHADRDIERLSDDRAKTALQTYHNTIEQSFFALCPERERMVQWELVKSV